MISMKNTFIPLLLIIVAVSISKAQIYQRNANIIVIGNNNDTLTHAWDGGFNSMQFSEIDLNFDGKKDLFAFDRVGNRILTYINNGGPNETKYTLDLSYKNNFPKLHDWVLLRDYNCDGKEDIFTYSTGGAAIYKNTSNGSTLSFSLVTNLLYSNQPNPVNLYISSVDIPAIDDIDNDGDLDIVTFSLLGSYVEYHRNYSIENYGTCDSLAYELVNKCWGFFSENFSSNSVTLDDSCSWNVPNPQKQNGGNKHTGSTLLTLDLDENGTKDLVLGDVSFSNLTALTNSDPSPTFTSSHMTAQDTAFPANNQSTLKVDLEIFPAAFYLDVNNDGLKDLLVSPDCYNGCENYKSSWLYLNTNKNNNPTFNFVTKSFLQEEMIDLGEGANPTLIDYNNDGLLDLIIGNYGFYGSSYVSKLALYENIGTSLNPVFQLIDDDFGGLSSINLNVPSNKPTQGLCPTFGDLDNDGDKDMLVGDFQGNIHYFINTAGAGNPMNFSLAQANYQGIDVGNFAAPQLIDLSGDSLLDLVIGNRSGILKYYENTGTATNPVFTLTKDTMGGVDVKEWWNNSQGFSRPYFYYNQNDSIELLCSSLSGSIYYYKDITNNLTGNFTLIDTMFQNINEGPKASITAGDLNNNGFLDIIIGLDNGGVALYNYQILTTNNYQFDDIAFSIFPNPTKNTVNLTVSNSKKPNYITIRDITGRTVLTQPYTSIINVADLNSGIYLISIHFSDENFILTEKLIINK